MRFADPPRRRPPESIVPMINVVFLLLVFFLMTAQIAPPPPVEVTPPRADAGAPAEGEFTLYLGPGGGLAYRDSRGAEAALARLAADRAAYCAAAGCSKDAAPPVILRADAQVPGARLAALMPRIAQAGFARINLVTVPE
jgi:biopolymer transport protein ExbD